MEAVAHADAVEFADLVTPFLATDPARYSVHLTTVDLALRGSDATLISLHDNGNLAGVATRLRPARPVQVAGMPPGGAEALANLLRSADPEVPAVVGPRDRVSEFRAAWSPDGVETVATLLYRLDALISPNVPGDAREVPLSSLGDWWRAFLRDTTEMTDEEAFAFVEANRAMPTRHVVWEVDSTPVAWAATTVPVGGVSRIGPVYTPPDQRGNGYAAAATAAITRWALDAGAHEVVLMTNADAAGPNRLYRRLGFEVIGDWSYWTFS
ncbi:putative acetyltransferase [Lentzea sp. NBRC 105346]|uniref:GNAT family N-acetyltransferase n=1 Tax=Lentzea sp. NBRC 105346 TaxID=3032205 RepID=UPI0024A1EC04|nr:GNAT family N-acetyltransferase [Lentzea sp. NBRC 105346]GLZ30734.1 putative acetyltransferase [Lentzea sp. NBRC 105346]